jgi:formate C-acetyltransferase
LGLWQKEINVRDFIQRNYEPYEGDESFLANATERTRAIWNRLNELFVEEPEGRSRRFSNSKLYHSTSARLH